MQGEKQGGKLWWLCVCVLLCWESKKEKEGEEKGCITPIINQYKLE